MADTDTIFALSTPPGRSALAVFRISGAKCRGVFHHLTGTSCPKPRYAKLVGLSDPATAEKIDEAIVTFYEAPHSFTGEDCLELSVHGAASVIAALTRVVGSLAEVRLAEPGEFTRRAHLAGKFDLAQAEALADLIDSETEFQRRQALRALDGALGKKIENWRSRLLTVAALLESSLDFSDEGDVAMFDTRAIERVCRELRADMQEELSASDRSLSLRQGFTIAIAGPPNVGKSTLFNCLSGEDLAIVSEYAGTTRDLVRNRLDLRGVPVNLVDSAGLHESIDPVELIGMERARTTAASADLVIWLRSADTGAAPPEALPTPILEIWSKADEAPPPEGMLAVARNDSDSISNLVEELRNRALNVVGDGSEGSIIRERHRKSLERAMEDLERLAAHAARGDVELAAEECRLANDHLKGIAHGFDDEEVLGEIFRRFCVGK